LAKDRNAALFSTCGAEELSLYQSECSASQVRAVRKFPISLAGIAIKLQEKPEGEKQETVKPPEG
jgi:hypothetical protein